MDPPSFLIFHLKNLEVLKYLVEIIRILYFGLLIFKQESPLRLVQVNKICSCTHVI
jgi:hypothetical protein